MIRKELMGYLPRAINGADVLIKHYSQTQEYDKAISLVKELCKITATDSVYNEDLIEKLNKKINN